MAFEFKLPDLGEGIREAEVLAVKVSPDQEISEDQILFEVETDKAVVELPSPVAGKVIAVLVKEGQLVPVGNVMISIANTGAAIHQEEQTSKVDVTDLTNQVAKSNAGLRAQEQVAADQPIIAAPATRQLARELHIDLLKVRATGPGGKVTKEDVLAYVEGQKEPAKAQGISIATSNGAKDNYVPPDFGKFGKIERVPMRSLRRKTAQLMAQSWEKVPHVTHCDEANVSELEKFRLRLQEDNRFKSVKLTMITFVLKSVSIALKEFPEFNSSFDEKAEEIILKQYFNLGMAVATTKGLIVPVVKNVDKKNITELAVEISELAETARAGKIELEQLHGGTFTITNIGIIGGTSATPIINYPEAAILATMRATERAIVTNGKLATGLILPLCLAFDHRLADGAEAARFIRFVINMLEEPESFAKYI